MILIIILFYYPIAFCLTCSVRGRKGLHTQYFTVLTHNYNFFVLLKQFLFLIIPSSYYFLVLDLYYLVVSGLDMRRNYKLFTYFSKGTYKSIKTEGFVQ